MRLCFLYGASVDCDDGELCAAVTNENGRCVTVVGDVGDCAGGAVLVVADARDDDTPDAVRFCGDPALICEDPGVCAR